MADTEAAVLAAETLGRDMLDGILDVVRQFPGWDSLTQHQQDTHIQRVSQRVKQLIADGLGIIFQGNYPACVAELDTVTFGRSIKAKIVIAKDAKSRHELSDCAGQKVVVVMADPDLYFERMNEIQGAADQKDLFHDSDQPLGHMGQTEPKQPPADNTNALDDVLPPQPEPEALNIPKEIDEADLLTKLAELGVSIPASWTYEQRVDAYVWLLAAEKAKAEERPLPMLPSFLEWRDAAETGPSTEEGKREVGIDMGAPEGDKTVVSGGVVTWDGTPEQLVDLLAERRVVVTKKMVKQWNQTQKMAAFAWIAGKAKERPDFIPAPKVPGPGSEEFKP